MLLEVVFTFKGPIVLQELQQRLMLRIVHLIKTKVQEEEQLQLT